MLAVAAGSEQLTRAMRALEAAFLIGVEGVTEIWLVRHADCYQDLVDTIDPGLSTLGRDQARRLAERVKRARPSAIYSSPYRRAVETAHEISDDVRIDDRLVEIPIEGGGDESFALREPPTGVVERMRAVVAEIASQHAGQRVVVVSHGAAIVAYLTDVLRLEPGRLRMLPHYTGISVVRAIGERRMVGTLGDTGHLE